VDQDPEEAVAVVEPRPFHAAPEDVDLLPENDVLEGEAGAVGGERADGGEQIEEQAHGGGSGTIDVDARGLRE